MPVVVVPKALDYIIPREKEEFQKKIFTWMNLHTNDHVAFISALNALREKLNLPLVKPHRLNLYFDPEKLSSVNQFLYFNSIEHKEIYRLINELGERATPIFYVLPVYNLIERVVDLKPETFGEIFFHENRVHTITARAINLLYEALGA